MNSTLSAHVETVVRPPAIADISPPTFSVVVPTWCSAELIYPLLDSLASQTARDFEVVVSDGASTDGTVQVVETFRSRLPHLVIDSRKDSGIYDAINRGIMLARGRWILIMGADDQLAGCDVMERLRVIVQGCEEQFVYGDIRVSGNTWTLPQGARYGGRFTLARILAQNICQQSILYRRDIFGTLGPFNTRYPLCADWHFAMRVFNSLPTRWVDLVISVYDTTGSSSQAADEQFHSDFGRIIFNLFIERPLNLSLFLALLRRTYWRLMETVQRR